MAKKLTPQEIRDLKDQIPSARKQYKILREETKPGVDVFNPLIVSLWHGSCEYIQRNYPLWHFKSVIKRLIDKAEEKERKALEKSVSKQINTMLQKTKISHATEVPA